MSHLLPTDYMFWHNMAIATRAIAAHRQPNNNPWKWAQILIFGGLAQGPSSTHPSTTISGYQNTFQHEDGGRTSLPCWIVFLTWWENMAPHPACPHTYRRLWMAKHLLTWQGGPAPPCHIENTIRCDEEASCHVKNTIWRDKCIRKVGISFCSFCSPYSSLCNCIRQNKEE